MGDYFLNPSEWNYKVVHLQDDTYQVIRGENGGWESYSVKFQGSIADCGAYLRLIEDGYMPT